jgi:hypothetical protein
MDFNWYGLFKLEKTAQVRQVPESLYKHIHLKDIENVSTHKHDLKKAEEGQDFYCNEILGSYACRFGLADKNKV